MKAPETTIDQFLGGKIELEQPKHGFRAGTDSVLLAAAVAAKPNQSVLELGCGAGAALLCLSARVPSLELTGVEIQADYADLARRNAQANGIDAQILQGDVADLGSLVAHAQYDHVIMNPPFFRDADGSMAHDAGRRTAHHAAPDQLAQWIGAGVRRANGKGRVVIILPADRLSECVAELHASAARAIELLPIAARDGRAPSRVLVTARRGAAQTRLRAPLIMHEGPTHHYDGEDYSKAARALLRDGNGLDALATI